MAASSDSIVTLAERGNSGCTVILTWNSGNNDLCVRVKSPTDDFALFPPNDCALDTYYHPFYYRDKVLSSGNFR